MVGDEMLRPVEPFEIELPVGFTEPIVILPLRIEDGYGIYDDSVVDLVKELKDEGVEASFFHAASERHWRSFKGEAPIDLILWISSQVINELMLTGIQEALRRIFESSRPSKVYAKIVRERFDSEGNSTRFWFEYEGDGDNFIQSLTVLCSTEQKKKTDDDENG